MTARLGTSLPMLTIFLTLLSAGCHPQENSTRPEVVWGGRGERRGQFNKPRAIAIDDRDQLYVVDMTGRIQVFDADGGYLRSWRTPDVASGKPCGLSVDRQGRLMVADTHYHRVLFFTLEGRLLPERTIGGVCGEGPGEFHFVTDVAQDSQGCYYVAEYGDYDRIQKFSPSGEFMLQWGGHGGEPGQFVRPQGLAIDNQDWIWVADACNHRIQVFEVTDGNVRLARCWGEEGRAPGQLRYPYDLVLDSDQNVYVCEFGNHRVQKFSPDGQSLGCWGTAGRREGELTQPWALTRDSRGRIYVLDTYNDRVQRMRL